MTFNFSILLQLAQAAGEGDKSPFSTLLLIPIMLVIMYFLVIRPQRNEEKKRKEMIDGLKKGDEVITSSGIHGKVVEIKDNNEVVVLNIAKDTNVSFTASTVLKKKQADK
ncbi:MULTISPECIES: preprotein translocase subunit YajC [Leptospira]|uniref:Sec translocon accessory complex subunit YajC n=5 Tax=Leptospira weilii TaxID=28184 RepID=M3H582_9LEPT|nr:MULTISPECIES: preprotein translocase subunit YajC [Leptospira]EMF83955.1 preprotein translocase, YajC subunit [Leptospira weilii serovar Topaz str. LT2116]EMM71340.1 preprotein translocase, YajC subunit [Leptospira weilii str. 2006001855]EMY13110.1 preprotein translocase, YajC subunit [Leptospira weilii str. Ecochallenge]EKR64858.1 preprotein translocase, YajC subunit [Leptospira weilii str. 2006001853]EMJ67474.1 preprotein translocase, YajC subunit [Leptospira sp. P2653]